MAALSNVCGGESGEKEELEELELTRVAVKGTFVLFWCIFYNSGTLYAFEIFGAMENSLYIFI